MSEPEDDLEAAWERMMDGAEKSRRQRQCALAWGLLVPLALVILLAILAATNPY